MTVLFYGGALEYTGGEKSYTPTGCSDVRELVDELDSKLGGGFGDFLLDGENCFFLVNGRSIATTGGLATKLQPGDRIEVLPFIEAG